MSINKPWNKENANKKPSLLWKLSKRIINAILPDNEKAWNTFSQEAQQEMIKSLEEKDNLDLYSLDLTELCTNEPTNKWDRPQFKKWVIQKDSIWNYVIINWMKCREYQLWISGFVYENTNDRYHRFDWLKIWFCDKGNFIKSVDINDSGKIPTFNLPDDINEELGWPFYEVNYNINEWPLSNIGRNDIYDVQFPHIKETIKEAVDARYHKPEYEHSSNWVDGKDWNLLKINGTSFKPFEKGVSWFIYKEIFDEKWGKILLAEYKNWKMVWEWLILEPYNHKTYVISKK